jgi:hypothetical protein
MKEDSKNSILMTMMVFSISTKSWKQTTQTQSKMKSKMQLSLGHFRTVLTYPIIVMKMKMLISNAETTFMKMSL